MSDPSKSANIVSLRNRDAARALLFSSAANVQRVEKLELAIGEQAVLLELRSVTVGERGEIYKRAGIGKTKRKGKGSGAETETDVDVSEMEIQAVIACTHIREGDDEKAPLRKFFTQDDAEALRTRDVGGWFHMLAQKAMDLINTDEEEVRKNFKRMSSSNSSSE